MLRSIGLWFLLLGSATVHAQFSGGMSSLNFIAPPALSLNYDERTLPGRDSMNENRLAVNVPVSRSPKNMVAVSGLASNLHFDRPATLDSQAAVPRDLDRVELGLQYLHVLPERRTWGVRTSFGYAGDEMFNGTRDLSVSLSGHYSFPGTDRSSWVLTIFVANNSSIANYVPVPGFAYIYKDEEFSGLFGFPFAAMQWTPAVPWTFAFTLFGPNMNLEAAYGRAERTQVFAGWAWTRQRYMLSERVHERDRLTLEEKKLTAGVRLPVFAGLRAELQAGEDFDRALYIGDGIFNKDGGARGLASGAYVGVSVRAMF